MTAADKKCGNREKAAFAKAEGTLPKRIGYFHDKNFTLPGLTKTTTRDVVEAAFILAQLFVPIPFYRTTRAASALIVLKLGPPEEFDGPGGVLAMADMINLRDKAQREIWFDDAEQWSVNRAAGGAIYALPVCAHELGHCLGFGHTDEPRCLMNPYYSEMVTTPNEFEIATFYKRYPELAQA